MPRNSTITLKNTGVGILYIQTTELYTHIASNNLHGVINPIDGLLNDTS